MLYNLMIPAGDDEANASLKAMLDRRADITDYYRYFDNGWVVDTMLSINDLQKLVKELRAESFRHILTPIYGSSYVGWHDKKLWEWMQAKEAFPVPAARAPANDKPAVDAKDDATAQLKPFETADSFSDYEGAEEEIAAMRQILAGMMFRRDAAAAGLKLEDGFNNMLFVGPPGVGKTSMAKTMAFALRDEMRSKQKQPVYLVETKDIVARYTGQSVNNVKQILNMVAGGVLIIDEIDALLDISSYGAEILQTINTHMGNSVNAPIIIGTLYHSREAAFLNANQGLSSRFRHVVRLSAYDDAILLNIFESKAESAGLQVEPDALTALQSLIREVRKSKGANFGNAREVQNMISTVVDTVAVRYMRDGEAFRQKTSTKMNDADKEAFRSAFGVVRADDIPERDAITGLYRPRTIKAAPAVSHLRLVPSQDKPKEP